MHVQVTCMWPTTRSLRQVCFGCQQMHGNCEISGTSVTARGLHQVGVHKKCKVGSKVMSKPTIEELGDDAMWVPPPTPKVVGKAESPFERVLVGLVKEMKETRKSLERIVQDTLKVSWEMLSQMTALVDLVELVVQGNRFVRMQEMGWPESDREELPTRWSKKEKGKAKEVEPEEEAEEEGELVEEPEGDVDMTLAE